MARCRCLIFVLAVTAFGLMPAASAGAAFPGANGKIAFTSERSGNNADIYSTNPDGSGETRLTDDPARDKEPAWSPDGKKIAFVSERDPSDPGCDGFEIQCNSEIYVMNADGSAETRVTQTITAQEFQPTWTPDGRISFTRLSYCDAQGCLRNIFTANPDGSGEIQFHGGGNTSDPAWSPDGTRIVYLRTTSSSGGLFTANADGTGGLPFDDSGSSPDWAPDGSLIVFAHASLQTGASIATKRPDGTDLTPLTQGGQSPHFSPDGTKVVFTRPVAGLDQIHVMNADGTAAAPITTTSSNYFPDWQPIPLNYVRPEGASPFQAYLVPAYTPCAAPNRTHGSPLAFPACSPPTQSSGRLTLGTPDANGQPANGRASVFFATRVGDLKVKVTIRDIRKASDLSDYIGQLDVQTDLRITDRNNTPSPGGPGAATVTTHRCTCRSPARPRALRRSARTATSRRPSTPSTRARSRPAGVPSGRSGRCAPTTAVPTARPRPPATTRCSWCRGSSSHKRRKSLRPNQVTV
jgi:Tol biopolymer transport system component